MWTTIEEFLKNNQFATGGVLTLFLGGLLVYLRSVPSQLWDLFLYSFTTTLDVYNDNTAFDDLENWLNDYKYSKKCRKLLIKYKSTYDEDDHEIKNAQTLLIPNNSKHWFIYKNRLVWLIKTVESKDARDKHSIFMKMSIRIFSRNREIVCGLLKESKQSIIDNDNINIYTINVYGTGWTLSNKKPIRPINSVVTNTNILDNMVEDIQTFEKCREQYNRVGFPYKRCYLLHGSPGNGKTSAIIALASYLKKNIAYINIAEAGITSGSLLSMIHKAPVNSLLVLEDIDCANVATDRSNTKHRNEIKTLDLSTILNILDGVLTPCGLITIITTNKKENLDPAILRSGRVDRQYLFDNPTRKSITKLLRVFFNTSIQNEIDFVDKTIDLNTNFAQLSCHFMKYSDDINEALTQKVY